MHGRMAALALAVGCSTNVDGERGKPVDDAPVSEALSSFLTEHPFVGEDPRPWAVVPVVYVPSDQETNRDLEAIVEWMGGIARETQGFYGYATGGHTFELRPVEIIYGTATAAEVADSPDPVRLVGDSKA